MDAARTQLWTAGWSRGRRAAVAAFGLFMLYVQSLYFTGFYIPEEEYWFPFWTGMTVGDRMISLALATWSNFGLIIAPFMKQAPGRIVRFLLIGSLASGAIVSIAWLAGSLSDWTNTAVQYPDRFVDILLALAPSTITLYTIYSVHIYLCTWFIFQISSTQAPHHLSS